MNESKEASAFLGTYFDGDSVLRVARWIDVLWSAVAVVYVLDLLLSAGVLGLQSARGFWAGSGFADTASKILLIPGRPFLGLVYSVALQANGKVLLILMDMEDSPR